MHRSFAPADSRPRALRLAAMIAAGLATAMASHGAIAGKLKTLHAFCAQAGCRDGAMPFGITRDGAGNLFGVASIGGHGAGLVFALFASGDKYRFKVLHTFCAKTGCPDGGTPTDRPVVDVNGNLYGVTTNGGPFDGGTVFELVRNPDTGKYKLVTLHSFCSQPNCADGSSPVSGLTYQGAEAGLPYDGASPLFGSATGGGEASGGVIYRLTYVQGKTKRKETPIYAFCSQGNCADGQLPYGRVIVDASGNFYGTTLWGGAGGAGVVFELSPTKKSYTETVLHSFCETDCSDGTWPTSALVMDGAGTLYGTTSGEEAPPSTAFKLVPNGGDSRLTVLHTFCSEQACADGEMAYGGLVVDPSGRLIGTTVGGGRFGYGTVYQLDGSNLSTLHDFCAKAGCSDGQDPSYWTSVVMDGSGNIFGTTIGGGIHAFGVVYELAP